MQLRSDFLGIGATVVSLFAALAHADEVGCKTVRFTDLGWSDIATTADLASVALEGSGYKAGPNRAVKAFLKMNREPLAGRRRGTSVRAVPPIFIGGTTPLLFSIQLP